MDLASERRRRIALGTRHAENPQLAAGSIPATPSPEELRDILPQTRAEAEATIPEFGLQQDR